MSDATVNGAELRQIVEKYEHLAAEKKDITDQMSDLLADAGGRGFDKAVIKRVVAERKRKAADVAEEAAILDLYKAALGMT